MATVLILNFHFIELFLTPKALRGQILAFAVFGQAPTSAINFHIF
jgi:hypothetical protein